MIFPPLGVVDLWGGDSVRVCAIARWGYAKFARCVLEGERVDALWLGGHRGLPLHLYAHTTGGFRLRRVGKEFARSCGSVGRLRFGGA